MIEIIIPFLISFAIVYIAMPFWIKEAEEYGFTAKDMHKHNKKVAELGGVILILGFSIGILSYIAISVFLFKNQNYVVATFAALVAVLIATIIGLVDDILGWKKGLRKYQKVLLTFLICLPIVVINAGYSKIYLPFIGVTEVGLLFPLLFVPIGIVGASNGFNMIAGYNGLEALSGIIILSTLGLISYMNNAFFAFVISFCMVGALIGFYLYNRYPAGVFPGDSLTYSVGALIAIVAIIGNIEKFALIIFIPYFIQLILKSRSIMQKESFAKLNKDSSLDNPYNGYYAIEHLAIDVLKKIKRKVYEKDVVLSLAIFQLSFSFICFFVFLIQ